MYIGGSASKPPLRGVTPLRTLYSKTPDMGVFETGFQRDMSLWWGVGLSPTSTAAKEQHAMPDTIFAPATPAGGAIAVIRASGPDCARALFALTGKTPDATPRRMARAAITSAGKQLDDAMAVFYRAPASYTGEDMFELFCHGGPAVLRAVLGALTEEGLRPAEPGEFTRRAFLNGKMDLTQSEAVMDLIQAQARLSADAALEQMQGRLRDEIVTVEALLTDALSAISAAIDYPEELDEDVFTALPGQLAVARASLESLIAQGKGGRVLREGFRVVLMGRPNAGKSSLLNALLGYDRAIVTPQPGTTRDVLEEALTLDGIPLRLFDTAGLREAADEAEREGVARARDAFSQADAVLVLLDGSAPLTEADFSLLRDTVNAPRVLLRTKADLPKGWDVRLEGLHPNERLMDISVRTGEGIEPLREALKTIAGPIAGAYVTNARHIHALQEALCAVRQAKAAADYDCAATDIRDALSALGHITGRAVDDAVIDRIFERFCVGK